MNAFKSLSNISSDGDGFTIVHEKKKAQNLRCRLLCWVHYCREVNVHEQHEVKRENILNMVKSKA